MQESKKGEVMGEMVGDTKGKAREERENDSEVRTTGMNTADRSSRGVEFCSALSNVNQRVDRVV
jgi:hypothetical protein